MYKEIKGGVCAAKGFRAAGVYCGIKKQRKKDLALIVSENKAAAACVYTQNLVKGAPIYVTREHARDGFAQAVIVNSGNANTCNENGMEIARGMCTLVEEHTGIPAGDVLVASTGVIGQPLSLAPIRSGMADLVPALGEDSSGAAEAIMTTDTTKKEIAFEFQLAGKSCRIGGIAKGSGMIHPNMATMLVFLTTDAAISPEMLQKAITRDVRDSFNMLSVDGDTSTNDMLTILANGQAGNEEIAKEGPDYDAFRAVLGQATRALCEMIAGDGEGATKTLQCDVSGAGDESAARAIAKSVICSPLVKCAMFGSDANWGRVLCAIGYAGVPVDVDKVSVRFLSENGSLSVCREGRGLPFSEELAKKVLDSQKVTIDIALGDGPAFATAWGCDLTYEYVRINGDYRS